MLRILVKRARGTVMHLIHYILGGDVPMRYRLIQYSNGVIEAAILLVVIVTPIFFNLHSSRVFEPDKAALLRALAIVIACTWMIGRLLAWEIHVPSRSGGLPVKLLGALIVTYAVSTLLSVAPLESALGSYHRQHGAATAAALLVVCVAAAAVMRSRQQIDRALRLIAITSLPVALYALLQWAERDPLIWSAAVPVSSRPPSTLGNPIFLAAYLALGVLTSLTVAIGIAPSIARETVPRSASVAQVLGYGAITLIDLGAIIVSGSRGPLLGVAAGLFFVALLSTLHRRRGRWAFATLAAGALLMAMLVALNLAGGPFEKLRDNPTMARLGRLGHILDTTSDTQRVRVLVWEAVSRLILPNLHPEHPAAPFDALRVARPLVGYGPETLPLLFGRVYPPALARLEETDTVPDRAHSHSLDALFQLGLLGTLAMLGLLIWLLQLALLQLGVISRQNRHRMFACLIGGMGVAAALAALHGGFPFAVVALPFGLVLGLTLYLSLQIMRFRQQPAQQGAPILESDRWRAGVCILVASIVLTHVIETGVGISVVATSVIFWLCAGLLVALAASNESVSPAATPSADSGPALGGDGSWLRAAGIAGTLTAMVLVTLVYDFVTYDRASWWQSATPALPLPRRAIDLSGMAVVMAATWFVGGTLATLGELHLRSGQRPWWRTLFLSLGGSLVVAATCWLAAGLRIAAISAAAQEGLLPMLAVADRIGRLLTDYVIAILGLLAVLGILIRPRWPPANSHPTARRIRLALVIAGCLALLVALGIGVRLALRPVRADMMHDVGGRLELRRAHRAAVPLYERASALAPHEDYHYLALGRAFLNAARSHPNRVERNLLLDQAIQALQRGQALNPLHPDYAVELARVYTDKTAVATDSERRTLASRANAFYKQATALKPNHAELWNEWAILTSTVLGDSKTAAVMLQRSISLDPRLAQTEQNLEDLKR